MRLEDARNEAELSQQQQPTTATTATVHDNFQRGHNNLVISCQISTLLAHRCNGVSGEKKITVINVL